MKVARRAAAYELMTGGCQKNNKVAKGSQAYLPTGELDPTQQ
jgi:hypothetical protein